MLGYNCLNLYNRISRCESFSSDYCADRQEEIEHDYGLEYNRDRSNRKMKKENGKKYERTLFIQEASIAAISHRLDSDRFEPLYAYICLETMLQ